MQAPPLPNNEPYRLGVLNSLNLLHHKSSRCFDSITHIAHKALDVPIVALSFIGSKTQWIVSAVGIPSQMVCPKKISFCGHTIFHNTLMVVEDTLHDQRFYDNPQVQSEPYIRFYAGFPLTTHDGLALGSLCIVDTKPRKLTQEDQTLLSALGMLACDELQRTINQYYKKDHLHGAGFLKHLDKKNNSTQKFVYYAMQRIKAEVVQSFTTEQEQGIKRALLASAPFQGHKIKITGTVPLFFKKAYFVFVMGRDRRKQTRDKEVKRRKMLHMATFLMALYFLIALCVPIILILIWLMKEWLRFDFIPAYDAPIEGIFWWF